MDFGTLDRFSDLPTCIIVHILSFLPTTEEAIRTGILSKRWLKVWTSIPDLNFSNNENRPVESFLDFVNQTLNQCCHMKLRKFSLMFAEQYKSCFASQLNGWIRYALDCNVEKLELDVRHRKEDFEFELPWIRYALERNLKNLEWERFELPDYFSAPKQVVSWKSLTMISFRSIQLSDDVFKNVLASSPVLEELKLSCCLGFEILEINSVSLKKLVLTCSRKQGLMKIIAPNILSLVVAGEVFPDKLSLVNVRSLTKANLFFEGRANQFYKDNINKFDLMAEHLLQSLCHVNDLAIGEWLIRSISRLRINDWRGPLSEQRKLLKLGNFIGRYDNFAGLSRLLDSSPNLEELQIYLDPPFTYLYPLNYRTEPNYTRWNNENFQCLQSHLKTIKIVYRDTEWESLWPDVQSALKTNGYFSSYDSKQDDVCELVQFFMENAGVLERLIISILEARPMTSRFRY